MRRLLILCSSLFFTLLLFCMVATPAAAANRYWVGTTDGASTNSTANWSTAQNTCGTSGGASVPGSSDVAIFTSSCTNSATVDTAFSVQGININSGYTGTVTQNSGISITIGSSGYVQAGGTFTGSDAAITISTSFSLSGGTFTSTSGTLGIITGFSITGGTFNHNNGSITVSGNGGASTWACNNATFNAVNISKTGQSITVGSDCILPISGTNPTLSFGTGGDTLTINGRLDITGNPTFSGTTVTLNGGGTITVTGSAMTFSRNLTLNGGTFPQGITSLTVGGNLDNSNNLLPSNLALTLNTNNASALTCGNATFNNVTISKSAGAALTVGSGCSLPLAGTDPSSTAAITNNGTISVTGNWTISGGYTTNSGATLTMTGNTLSTGSLTLNGGTFPSGITTLSTTASMSNVGNLLPNGIDYTTTGSSDVTIHCGTAVFNSFTNTHTAGGDLVTMASDCTTGTFNNSSVGSFDNPASSYVFTVTGDASFANSGTWGGGTNLTLRFSGSSNQTISQTNGIFNAPIVINKSGGTLQASTDLINAQPCTLQAGTFFLNGKTVLCTSVLTVNSGAILQMTGNDFTIPTLDAGSTLKLVGDGDSSADTFPLPPFSFGNLTISLTDSSDAISVTDSLANNLVGYWRMEEGTGSTVDDSSTNNNVGNLTNATFSTTVPTMHFTDNYSVNFDGTGDYIDIGSNTTYSQNKSAMTLGAAIKLNSTSGTKDIVGISSGTSTANDRVDMQMSGDELRCQGRAGDAEATQIVTTTNANLTTGTWYIVFCEFDFANDTIKPYVFDSEFQTSGSVSFTATATSNTAALASAIGIDEDKVGNDFSGQIDEVRIYDRLLTKAEKGFITAGYDTSAISSATLANNYTQTQGSFDAPATLNVAGNWIHSGGTFNHNSGTVILNGTDQTISGNTTFNNITKSVSAARTLTLTAGSLQTILGTVTFNGTSGNLLSLRSSSTNSQWSFDPQGTRTLSYLDVQDSNNTNGTAITTSGNNITNSGNNTNWDFDVAAPSISLTAYTPDPGSDTTPLITGTAQDVVGIVTAVQFQMDSTAGSWTSCTANDGTFDEATEAFSCQVSSALSEGSHTINVRATDNALPPNTTADGSVATDSFVIDTTAPGSPDSPSTTSPTNSATQNWLWNAVSGAATYAWRITTNLGAAVDSGTTALTNYTSSLAQGAYIFYVKAIDAASNESSESSGTVTVDTTSPSTPGDPSTASTGDDATPTWTWTASTDSGGAGLAATPYIVEWSQDSGFSSGVSSSTATTTSFTHTSDLSAGTWYFRVKAQDAAGNESSYTSNGTITITVNSSPSADTTAPQAVELSSPEQSSYTNQDRPTFKWKTTTDGSSGITKYKLIAEYGFDVNSNTGKTFAIDDIPPSRTEKLETDRYVINYENFSDSDNSNNYISIYTKSSNQWGSDENDGKLNNGNRLWSVIAYDGASNTITSTRELFVDRQNPNLSGLTFNGTAVTSALGTNSTQPVIAGIISDSPGGEIAAKYVSSGPRSVEVKIEQENFSGYQTILVTNFNVSDGPYYDCNGLTPDDHHNNCIKSLPFSYKVSQPLSYGQYRMSVTGQDQAGNNSVTEIILFTITSTSNLAVAPTPAATTEPEPTRTPSATSTASATVAEKPSEPLVTVPIKPPEPSILEKLFNSIGNGFHSVGSFISTSFGSISKGIADATDNLQNNSSGFWHVVVTSTVSTSSKIAQGTGYMLSALSNGTKASVINTRHVIAQSSFRLAESLTHGAGAASNSLSLAIVKFGYLFATEPTRISNVAVKINSPTSATITWETNHPATSKVNYGLDETYPFDSQTDLRVMHHEITLTDLKPNTEYHFEVMSQNHNYVYDANRKFSTPGE